MNGHVPQSISALAEVGTLMRAEAHIVSGQSNAPVNGIVQDGLNGLYLLTNRWDDNSETLIPIEIFKKCYEEAEISKERCTNMLIRASTYYKEYISVRKGKNGILTPVFKKKKIPGKIYASIIFPPNLNYKRKTDTNPNFPIVKIKNGILKPNSGPICKKIAGAKANSVVHLLFIEYSPDEALRFLSDCQQIVDHWLPNHGFSMGIEDCTATSDEEVAKTLLEMKLKIETILKGCGGVTSQDEELEINSILNSAMNVGLKIAKTSMAKGDKNALNIMRNAGAKGSLVNLTQIVSFVGQQNINGQRIPATLSDKSRTLPHFSQNDNTAEARGFVEHGYLKGLTPAETFFHAASGRTGIISTSIKSVTRETQIFIIEDEVPKSVLIGDWIDDHILHASTNGSTSTTIGATIQNVDGIDVEYLELDSEVYIPTVNDYGKVSWDIVSAITRHDPTENLYRITTEYGRMVIVAESKSLVVWNPETNKLQQAHLLNIKEGDMLPITQFLENFPREIKYLNLPSHHIENPGGIKKFILDKNNGYLLGAIISSCSVHNDSLISIKPKYDFCSSTIVNLCCALDKLKIEYSIVKDESETLSSSETLTSPSLTVYIKSKVLLYFVASISKNLNNVILSPLEFKEGLLDGYFSFGGWCERGICRLFIEDYENLSILEANIVNMICNHFGIVIKFHSKNKIYIEGVFLAILKNNIYITNSLLRENIQDEVSEYDFENTPKSFYNNILLDRIVYIEKLKSTPGEKLYDLTIPSTLNFCLANGLHVADTSDTGYIQKKIGRKIEDCKTWIDGTVRICGGRIIQFLYGDDGMNPKFLYVPKNMDFPFFVNPINIARRLNSDAIQKSIVSSTSTTRNLFKPEINLIISFINSGPPYLKSEVIETATYNARMILRKLLEDPELKIYEVMIPEFCGEIKNMCEIAKIQYGEMVGLHTASFIGEPTTQMMLDAFHHSGIKGKDVSLGVPRFNELLNATKSNKQKKISQTIYFDNPSLNENREKIAEESLKPNPDASLIKELKIKNLTILENMKNKFEETSVSTFIKKIDMQYLSQDVDPDVNLSPIKILTYTEYEKKWWVSLREELFEPPRIHPEHWVVVLYFDIEKLYNYNINIEEIAVLIEEESEDKYYCYASPNALGTIEVYCNFSVIGDYVKNNLKDDLEGKKNSLITKENINYFICRDVVIGYLSNIKLTGIMGIKKTFPREVTGTGEWVLDANCKEIASKNSTNRFIESLTMEGTDPYKTVIDDMHSIHATLGIEAARRFLIEEFTRIISFDGVYINPRHIQLLIDSMTYTGEITSVRRDGISRDVGPNAKIMFEQAVENAVEASAFSEFDDMMGISSTIMYGLTSKAGTGVVEIRPDTYIPIEKVKVHTDTNMLDLEEVKDDAPSTSTSAISTSGIDTASKKETPLEKRKRFNSRIDSKRKSVIR